jgi:hypothetical protein
MENTYLVDDELASFTENNPTDSIRLEKIADLNLLHVEKSVTDCFNLLLERMMFLDGMGLKMTPAELEKIVADFYGLEPNDADE